LFIKSFRNQACFMSLNNTFKGKFGHVYPSTLYNVLSLWSGNQVPSVILRQRIDLCLQSMFPLSSSLSIRVGNRIINFKYTSHQCNAGMLLLTLRLSYGGNITGINSNNFNCLGSLEEKTRNM
jgi:hypothetical protein